MVEQLVMMAVTVVSDGGVAVVDSDSTSSNDGGIIGVDGGNG